MIFYDYKKSDFGYTLIAYTHKGICAILFGWDQDEALEKLFPSTDIQSVYSPQYAMKIIKHLNVGNDLSNIPIDIICGTPFQQLVWQNLRKVTIGSTITYSELATK